MPLEITALADPNLLLALNNAAVPDVGELSLPKASWLAEHCVVPGLAMLDSQPAGMVVVLDDTSGYDSDFYRWFTDRYANFLYIDRVVVSAWARGRGIARELYQHIEQVAREQGRAVVSDVYSDPPNTPSLNLHRSMGFEAVGKQHFPAQQKIATNFIKYPQHAKQK